MNARRLFALYSCNWLCLILDFPLQNQMTELEVLVWFWSNCAVVEHFFVACHSLCTPRVNKLFAWILCLLTGLCVDKNCAQNSTLDCLNFKIQFLLPVNYCKTFRRILVLFDFAKMFKYRLYADVPARGGGLINGLNSDDLDDDEYIEEDSDELMAIKNTGNRLGGLDFCLTLSCSVRHRLMMHINEKENLLNFPSKFWIFHRLTPIGLKILN